MSEAAEQAAPAEPKEGAAPKKKSKLMLIIILAVVLAGGGGGAFFFLKKSGAKAAGKAKKKVAAEEEESAEAESSDEEEESEEEESRGKKSKFGLPDDSKVKQVVELQPFIINLADKTEARYLRLTLSIGVGGEGKGEEKPDPLFITRVRNAMLAVLTTKTSDEIMTIEGKAALRKELLRAAQAASKEPKVQAIYITDFIIQL
jgi:flagellar FliL protein